MLSYTVYLVVLKEIVNLMNGYHLYGVRTLSYSNVPK